MILRNLERRPWKAMLSTLGLAFAGAILIVGFYFYDAIEHLVRVEFQTAAREDVGITFNEPHGSSARYSVERLPGVLRAEPFRVVAARLRFEHRSRRVGILGLADDRDLRRIVDQHLRVIDLPPEGIVLSASLARILGVSPGDTLTIEVLEGQRPVRQMIVAGTVEDLIGTSAYMDIHALNRLMREGETISGAFLSVDSLVGPEIVFLLETDPGGKRSQRPRSNAPEFPGHHCAEPQHLHGRADRLCLCHRVRHCLQWRSDRAVGTRARIGILARAGLHAHGDWMDAARRTGYPCRSLDSAGISVRLRNLRLAGVLHAVGAVSHAAGDQRPYLCVRVHHGHTGIGHLRPVDLRRSFASSTSSRC